MLFLLALALQEPVDDAAILREIGKKGGELVAAKRTTPAEELRKQLSRPKCKAELPAPSKEPITAAETYRRRTAATLVIAALRLCDKCSDWHATCASGFVLTDGGVAATNYHVIDQLDATHFVARTSDGGVVPVAEVLAASKDDDVAILRLDGKGFAPAPLATAQVGETVRVISHPNSQFYLLTEGLVSRYHRHAHEGKAAVTMMTISAPFATGSSGAPVFDASGNAAGMVSSTRSVYADKPHTEERKLQMVMFECVPAESIRGLTAP